MVEQGERRLAAEGWGYQTSLNHAQIYRVCPPLFPLPYIDAVPASSGIVALPVEGLLSRARWRKAKASCQP